MSTETKQKRAKKTIAHLGKHKEMLEKKIKEYQQELANVNRSIDELKTMFEQPVDSRAVNYLLDLSSEELQAKGYYNKAILRLGLLMYFCAETVNIFNIEWTPARYNELVEYCDQIVWSNITSDVVSELAKCTPNKK